MLQKAPGCHPVHVQAVQILQDLVPRVVQLVQSVDEPPGLLGPLRSHSFAVVAAAASITNGETAAASEGVRGRQRKRGRRRRGGQI